LDNFYGINVEPADPSHQVTQPIMRQRVKVAQCPMRKHAVWWG